MNMLTSTKEYALIRILKTVKIVGHYIVLGLFKSNYTHHIAAHVY